MNKRKGETRSNKKISNMLLRITYGYEIRVWSINAHSLPGIKIKKIPGKFAHHNLFRCFQQQQKINIQYVFLIFTLYVSFFLANNHFCLSHAQALAVRFVWHTLKIFINFLKCALVYYCENNVQCVQIHTDFELNRKDNSTFSVFHQNDWHFPNEKHPEKNKREWRKEMTQLVIHLKMFSNYSNLPPTEHCCSAKYSDDRNNGNFSHFVHISTKAKIWYMNNKPVK